QPEPSFPICVGTGGVKCGLIALQRSPEAGEKSHLLLLRAGGAFELQLWRVLRRLRAVHVIVATGRDVFRKLPAQRANVRNNLPDLEVGYLAAEGGHAVRTPFDNRRVDVLRLG